MPLKIKQAVIAIWLTLAIDVGLGVYKQLSGQSAEGEFLVTIIIYALLSIIPYKIMKKSNAARYFYLLLTILSVAIFFGSMDYERYRLEYIVSVIITPIEIFIIYRLFQKGSSAWFVKAKE